MNVVLNVCYRDWMWSQMKISQMKKTHVNVVSDEQVSKERGLKWLWSHDRGLKWSGLKWIGLK